MPRIDHRIPEIPPGRRERRERWSASGVRLELDGASSLPEALYRFLAHAVPVVGVSALTLTILAHLPLPTEPVALSCNAQTRWTQTCRAVEPTQLTNAVDPPELARRLAATWDFGPDNGLWRAGGAPYHLVQQARRLRDSNDSAALRARAATNLAKVLEAPTSYAGWQPSAEAVEAVDAELVAALYSAEADDAWQAHQAAVRSDWEAHKAVQSSIQGPLRWVDLPLGLLWLGLTLLGLIVGLERLRAHRPLELQVDAHQLHLEGNSISLALIADVDVRWGRLELLLRDGSRWVSRPLSPRNPGRLELLLKAMVHARDDALEEREAREHAHQALAQVLSRATSG